MEIPFGAFTLCGRCYSPDGSAGVSASVFFVVLFFGVASPSVFLALVVVVFFFGAGPVPSFADAGFGARVLPPFAAALASATSCFTRCSFRCRLWRISLLRILMAINLRPIILPALGG